ncbi:hypothetical protein I305_06698 [Cryptococcus gattii E566]|uniref:Uncharacterized protein n=1 Tax=Cryptococcus gattii EJB2 TaxID=1296103 RepID=A0ABR5BTR3_9TREE|nr:hypothetical protein I306_03933 [Cryptococcus gattii EJB2]KIY30815.1 hypothetical protein I305_06698 [Cryptococcus gattii E566]
MASLFYVTPIPTSLPFSQQIFAWSQNIKWNFTYQQ